MDTLTVNVATCAVTEPVLIPLVASANQTCSSLVAYCVSGAEFVDIAAVAARAIGITSSVFFGLRAVASGNASLQAIRRLRIDKIEGSERNVLISYVARDAISTVMDTLACGLSGFASWGLGLVPGLVAGEVCSVVGRECVSLVASLNVSCAGSSFPVVIPLSEVFARMPG